MYFTLLKSPKYSFANWVGGRDKNRYLYSVIPKYIFERNKQGGRGECVYVTMTFWPLQAVKGILEQGGYCSRKLSVRNIVCDFKGNKNKGVRKAKPIWEYRTEDRNKDNSETWIILNTNAPKSFWLESISNNEWKGKYRVFYIAVTPLLWPPSIHTKYRKRKSLSL